MTAKVKTRIKLSWLAGFQCNERLEYTCGSGEDDLESFSDGFVNNVSPVLCDLTSSDITLDTCGSSLSELLAKSCLSVESCPLLSAFAMAQLICASCS